MGRQKFAIVISSDDEPLRQCLDAIAPQVGRVLVIETMGRRSIFGIADKNVAILRSENDDVNISKWWNQGLDMVMWLARRDRASEWDVAILNEDVVVPTGWFSAVVNNMRGRGAAAGCSGGTSSVLFSTDPGPEPADRCLDSTAFVVAGEKGVRANATFGWDYANTYMDWESRKKGGVVVVPGFSVNRLGESLSPPLSPSLTSRDSAQFYRLYGGMMP